MYILNLTQYTGNVESFVTSQIANVQRLTARIGTNASAMSSNLNLTQYTGNVEAFVTSQIANVQP